MSTSKKSKKKVVGKKISKKETTTYISDSLSDSFSFMLSKNPHLISYSSVPPLDGVYGQKVRVLSGFYRGKVGVLDWFQEIDATYTVRFPVLWGTDVCHCFSSSELEPVLPLWDRLRNWFLQLGK